VTSYSQKLHAFKPAIRWTLTDEGVAWEELEADKRSGNIPLSKIQKVRLRFEPSRAETRRVGLHIYAPFDHHITNIHYVGVMDFNLQQAEFRDFVLAFHALFGSETRTEFHHGSTWGAYLGNLAITVFLCALLLLLAPIIALTGIPGGTAIIRIGIILIFLPIVFRVLKKNRPRRYQPDSVPMELLE